MVLIGAGEQSFVGDIRLPAWGWLRLSASCQPNHDYAREKAFRFHNFDLNRFGLRRKRNFEVTKLFSPNFAKESQVGLGNSPAL
jgi:hypothetical protein